MIQLLAKRFYQVVLIGTFIGFSWLAMQAVHEFGHVLVARVTGAEVIKVVLHPLVMSRTDVGHNPHPLAVVWAGPLIGSVFPLLLFGVAFTSRFPGAYLFRFFSGFCLVANGVYIGIGWLLAEGADPDIMTEHGSPVWALVVFGLLAVPLGFYLWHRQGPHFGLGDAEGKVNRWAAAAAAALFLALVGVELIWFGK